MRGAHGRHDLAASRMRAPINLTALTSLGRALLLCGALVSRALGQADLYPSLVTPVRYPLMLRSVNAEGMVRFEGRIDRTGRIDMSSLHILESTHELFSAVVKAALPEWRFPRQPAGPPARRFVHVVRFILFPLDTTRGRACPTGERGTTTVCAPSVRRQSYCVEPGERRARRAVRTAHEAAPDDPCNDSERRPCTVARSSTKAVVPDGPVHYPSIA
jgi:hypothetical protein